METGKTILLQNHQALIDRFITACQLDDRIVAAFLGGSFASGKADQYSDLDLFIILIDEALDEFNTNRTDFLRLLGEPLFVEDFDFPNLVFCIFGDGTEFELHIAPESKYSNIYGGTYVVLVDKKDILAGADLSFAEPDPLERAEELRRLVYWFWHDLSHFINAMRRDQLWWAQGQLEELRRYCINLARLRSNFAAPGAGDEPYFKVDKAIQVEQLSPLKETFCPIEKSAMLLSGINIVRFFKELAVSLSKTHEIPYPEALERIMVQRLEDLQKAMS